MVAKYHPGTAARVDRTPDVGVYKIKYAAGDPDSELRTLHGSKRFLGKGQPVGFVAGEGGEVIAVAGEERFAARLPADTRFCVWYTKTEEPSGFARGAGQTAEALANTAIAVGVVGGIVALGLLHLHDHDRRHCPHGYQSRDRCRTCSRD
jgi:hypothetical protein